jgi:uncharacterized protein (TIGR03435 family)
MRGGPGTADPGRMTWSGATLQALLISAYGVKTDQISGPGWLESERYDIEAKVPPGSTRPQFILMLQNLLADRFKLALHKDTKEFSVYELTVAKDGPKLKPSPPDPDFKPPAEGTRAGTGGLDKDGFPILLPGERQGGRFGNGVVHSTFRMYTMSDFAKDLEALINMANGDSPFAPVHVIDRTGLTAQYDFKLESAGEVVLPNNRAAQGTPADPGSAAPSLFTALEKQLGLKLEHSKQPLDIIVIDRVEKTPTDN